MKDNKLLYNTRKTYHKVLKLNSIIMLDINHIDKIVNTLEYGRNNYLGSLCDLDREHIYRLIEYFNIISEEIEDFYG